MEKFITVRGARVHNLKNIDVKIPRDKLVVLTGLSGSGKSSLAFDTIYAEGHRRFVESLSAYARQFLGQFDKPDIDGIDGLSPAIAIDQKTTSKNPRSTVGTVTEIYDYLRLLYARVGIPHCHECGKEITRRTTDSIIDEIMQAASDTPPAECKVALDERFMLLAPVVMAQKGTHEKIFESARRSGYARARVNGSIYELTETIPLDKNKRHTIEVVVDRLVMRPDIRSRLSGSIETALTLSGGSLIIATVDSNGDIATEHAYSQNFACAEHGVSFMELSPRMFSFNNPQGACPTCYGLGERQELVMEKAFPDMSKSLNDGAINVKHTEFTNKNSWHFSIFRTLAEPLGYTMDTPLAEFSKEALDAFMNGVQRKRFDCIIPNSGGKTRNIPWIGMIAVIRNHTGGGNREGFEELYATVPCPACNGGRLNPSMLAVTVGGVNIHELCSMPIGKLVQHYENIRLNETDKHIARDILTEIKSRLGFLNAVGLDYITLTRRSGTLSGGEAQRIRLATQIGSSLMGVLYILDEPSIGLHQRDNQKLIATLKKLRDTGNSVIVVEHDEETILESDYVLDMGPGAGVNGGQIIAHGTPKQLMKDKNSVTGPWLSGKRKIHTPPSRRSGNGNFLKLTGAQHNNLKNVDVSLPLGTLTVVTGVSGSGKSSLINGILHPILARQLNRASTRAGKYATIEGVEHLDKIIAIDQTPIGRTPRSNPATYTGTFGDIRELFAQTPDAKKRGFLAGRFSFNVKSGRCEACEGDGVKRIEMHFLPDVYVTCDSCNGKRYCRDTLEVMYKGKNISDVLEMTIDEGCEFFVNIPKISRKLATLQQVGLGYLKLGQSSTTLSGGEAQRVKLASELSKRDTGRTIYILDEPTTGLHGVDTERLISVLGQLVELGNTVVVIEHNLDVIAVADYIIDMGPEGGDRGGTLVASGTPEEVAQCTESHTAPFIKARLNPDPNTLNE